MDTTNKTAAPMTDADARRVFDAAIKGETDPDRITKVELLREFFCNPKFRAAMTDEVARVNGF